MPLYADLHWGRSLDPKCSSQKSWHMVSKFSKGFLGKMAFELGFKEQVELRMWKWAVKQCKWEKSGEKATGRKSQSRLGWLKDSGDKEEGRG